MIGDAYFDLRYRLGDELHRLAETIQDIGCDAQSTAIVDNLITSLKEPFVFVVVGEVNVGKSTFLNALFGHDFSRTGVVPTTDKILFFKHGPKHEVIPITRTLDEVHVPAEFLRDFHIVDTPGTNSVESEHQEITERFVPISDLVIFVFSAMNPWGASAWQFLDRVHKQWMRNVVFVLQQCDLRTPEEIQVIKDYMSQLCKQRFGRDFPLFAVSAKTAYMARSSPADGQRLLQESGFAALEAHISALVSRNSPRLNKLSSTVRMARQLLDAFRQQVAGAMHNAQRSVSLIRELQTERELQADRTLKKILPALDATERDYHECCFRIAGMAEDALATRRAFSKVTDEEEESGQESMDHRFFQELQHRAGERWHQVGLILEEDFLQYQRFLHTQGKGSLFPADDHVSMDGEPEVRRLFNAHVDSTIRRFVLGLKMDESIEPGLLRARRRARWVPWLVLPLFAATAVAWYFQGPLAAGVSAVGGLLLIGFAFLMTQVALNHTRRTLLDRLDAASSTLRQMLYEQVSEDVRHLFGRFVGVLEPVKEEAEKLEQQMVAESERLRILAESLLVLDRSIHEMPGQRS